MWESAAEDAEAIRFGTTQGRRRRTDCLSIHTENICFISKTKKCDGIILPSLRDQKYAPRPSADEDARALHPRVRTRRRRVDREHRDRRASTNANASSCVFLAHHRFSIASAAFTEHATSIRIE